jgi:hypothetical protein
MARLNLACVLKSPNHRSTCWRWGGEYALFADTPENNWENGGEKSVRTVMVDGVKIQISEII